MHVAGGKQKSLGSILKACVLHGMLDKTLDLFLLPTYIMWKGDSSEKSRITNLNPEPLLAILNTLVPPKCQKSSFFGFLLASKGAGHTLLSISWTAVCSSRCGMQSKGELCALWRMRNTETFGAVHVFGRNGRQNMGNVADP